MNKYVTSLELSKRLKELGVEQDSLFYWHTPNEKEKFVVDNKVDEYSVSAFTVAELGEKLPELKDNTSEVYKLSTLKRGKDSWTVSYMTNNNAMYQSHFESSDTEAEARGEMLAYLIDNKLI